MTSSTMRLNSFLKAAVPLIAAPVRQYSTMEASKPAFFIRRRNKVRLQSACLF
jgi:hypothetical protein